MKSNLIVITLSVLMLQSGFSFATAPLSSWNDNQTKEAILTFVQKVTTKGSDTFVAPSQRIAVFDNDGTLWVEQPMYPQLAFVFDRVKALAGQHPEWKDTQPFKAVLENDLDTLGKQGTKSLVELLMHTHSGMSSDVFNETASGWLKKAVHPKFKRPYTQTVYQPMLELLDYLRVSGFRTYIVSGGGVAFMRPFTEQVYGIPPEQVIGSSVVTKFEILDNKPQIVRLPEVFFIDDKEGKPVAIDRIIGKRPILAFGNSDGDLQMLQWTSAGEGERLSLLLHHTDEEREYQYDRESHVGKLDKALDIAKEVNWIVVDMKKDWKLIFPFENE